MKRNAPLSFDQSQAHVEAMMEQGRAFSDIEDVIDASELSSVHKAALWLLAWSLRDVEQQRQDARLTLAAVAPASWEAGDASSSGTRQRWPWSAIECRKERAAIAPIELGSRARTSPARAPTRIRRAWSPDRPATA